ncbi:MAG TPA: peptidoglycan DD-metalloendopeptidase family protein [Gemmatimonadota bacterium]|nr:peptidoglycan DD-metalloendopeptidase family protein [Gemmatimonadota bacterium]
MTGPNVGRGGAWYAVRTPFLIALALAVGAWWALDPDPAAAPRTVVAAAPKAPPVIVDTLRPNETLSDVWDEHGLDRNDLVELVEAGEPLFSWQRLRTGTVSEFSFFPSGLVRQVALRLDRDRRVIFRRRAGSFEGQIVETPFRRTGRQFSTCVDGSLWDAFSGMGEDPTLAVILAEILGAQVDFYTDVHAGDCLDLALTADVRPDGSYRVVSLDAVRLDLKAGPHEAYRFSVSGDRDDWYDGEGRSLKRRFLRSPLKFTRISSGFGMRRHPITRRRAAHHGVDYVAPVGTPVQASGDGVVRRAGRNGGHGIFVELQHGKSYRTSYSHLSRIARGIRSGSPVQQGQVIGYVGSTGMSTGAHLDYRFMKDGRYVDPLSTDLPTAEPLDGKDLERFLLERDALRGRLAAAGPGSRLIRRAGVPDRDSGVGR